MCAMHTHNDEDFMRLALLEATKTAPSGDVPVGAVVVRDGMVIASGYNLREKAASATAHAEIVAIEAACKALGRWRLTDCTLYVTLEPCAMCTGAIINARLGRLVFGARDEKAGCCGSVANILDMPLNHRPTIRRDVLAEDCAALLKTFFASCRSSGKQQ